MTLAVALSPLILRGLMYPGSTHDQLLGRQHLHIPTENMYVYQVSQSLYVYV